MTDDLVERTRDIVTRLAGIAAEGDGDRATAADLARLLGRLDDPEATLVIVGTPNGGKSSLINALVGATLVPVDFQVATAVPIVVRHHDGDRPVAAAILTDGRQAFPVEDVADWAAVSGVQAERGVLAVEVGVPSPLLAGGLQIVDTPGVGGVDSGHSRLTLQALQRADAALMVLEAHQPISAPELDFLEQAATRVGIVLFAVNKIDDRPKAAWRSVLDENRRLIGQRLGIPEQDVVLLPVSAADAQRSRKAARNGDLEKSSRLRAAARIDALAEAIRDRVVADGLRQRLIGTLAHCAPIVARYAQACEHQLTTDAARIAELTGGVRAALRSDARWRKVLRDEYAELALDVDRIGTEAVNRRMKLLRGEVANRTRPADVATRAGEELGAVQAELTEAVDSRLPTIVMRVADELAVDGLDGLIAEFDPRITARSLNPGLSEQDARALGAELIQGAYSGAQAGFLAFRMAAPALQTAGLAVRGAAMAAPTVAATGAVAAGAVTTGAMTTGAVTTGAVTTGAVTTGAVTTTGAAAGGAGVGAGTVAAGGAVVAAGAVAILVGGVVIAVAIHRYHVKKRAAEATAVCDAADNYARDFLTEIAAGIDTSSRNLVSLIDQRLAERLAGLQVDPQQRAGAEQRRDRLATLERDRIALRTEVTAR